MSGRRPVGARGLERLRESLSERDQAIVSSLAGLRFMDARQLQRLHFPLGEHSPLGAARAARRALERLFRHGVLRRLDRRIGGVRAGSSGHVYCLGPVGVRLVAANRQRAIAREPSLVFLKHHLAVAEVVVSLQEATRYSDLELLGVEAEPRCWRQFYGVGGGTEIVKPDLSVELGLGELERHWFVEVDLGSEHRPALERKCAQYERYYRSGAEQQRRGLFPGVAWLVPDKARAAALREVVDQRTRGLFHVGLLGEAVRTFAGGRAPDGTEAEPYVASAPGSKSAVTEEGRTS